PFDEERAGANRAVALIADSRPRALLGGRGVVSDRFSHQLRDRLVDEAEDGVRGGLGGLWEIDGNHVVLLAAAHRAPLAAEREREHELSGALLGVVQKTRKFGI